MTDMLLVDDNLKRLIAALEPNAAPAVEKATAREVVTDLYLFVQSMEEEGLAKSRVTAWSPGAMFASLAVFVPIFKGKKTLFNCRCSPIDPRIVWLEWHIVSFRPKPGELDPWPLVRALLDRVQVITGHSHRVASPDRPREPETVYWLLAEPERRGLFFDAVRKFLKEISAEAGS